MKPRVWRHDPSLVLTVLLGILLWQAVVSLPAAGPAGEVAAGRIDADNVATSYPGFAAALTQLGATISAA